MMNQRISIGITVACFGLGIWTHSIAAAPSPTASAAAIFSMLSEGIETAFVEKRSPDELAAVSDLVVIGRVASVSDGRTIGAPEGDRRGLHTSVVKFVVESTLKGQAPQEIFIEQFRLGSLSSAVLRASDASDDDRVILFLENESRFALPPTTKRYNEGKGLPTGGRLYRVVSPQGVVVNLKGNAAQPLVDNVYQLFSGMSFDDAVAHTAAIGQRQPSRPDSPKPKAEPPGRPSSEGNGQPTTR